MLPLPPSISTTMVPLPAANLDHSTMLLAAGYIFGGNESRQKVAMTAPVGVSTGTEGAAAPGIRGGQAVSSSMQ
jgi:hypothetical protein